MVWKEPGKDKDPWDQGGQGSPDLEKLVQDLHRRFDSLFRRRRRHRGHDYLWLIPLLFASWIISGFYVVDEGDRGVNLLLGRYQAVTQPGLHWHAPWPLGGKEIVAGVDSGSDYLRSYNSLLTADGYAVTVEAGVHYRIVDLPAYLYANAVPGGGTAAVDILGNLADEAVSGAIATVPMGDLLGKGVDGVENTAHARLMESLKGRSTGLEVTQVELRKISMPAPVAAAYAGVRQAQLDAQKQADESQAYAADVLARARGEADSRVEAAKAYAGAVVERAHGDVAAFDDLLVAYRRAPAVTRESLTFSTFEEILAHVQRVIVVGKDNHVTLSLEKPAASPTAPTVQKSPSDKPASPKPPAGADGGGEP
jgi:modulator of FtsH protease HflK